MAGGAPGARRGEVEERARAQIDGGWSPGKKAGRPPRVPTRPRPACPERTSRPPVSQQKEGGSLEASPARAHAFPSTKKKTHADARMPPSPQLTLSSQLRPGRPRRRGRGRRVRRHPGPPLRGRGGRAGRVRRGRERKRGGGSGAVFFSFPSRARACPHPLSPLFTPFPVPATPRPASWPARSWWPRVATTASCTD